MDKIIDIDKSGPTQRPKTDPKFIEPKRKSKSGVKTRAGGSGNIRPKQQPKGYRIGGRVRLAKRGSGKAYGKNS